ncbi:MAG: hypothetical protein A3H96_00985 [Acidobacteria bacterium RIFCSPLOWO2_02_FULL_67_36]|nr:MAG: hypothetical protein A3H96_00985 [Acidobacteria bacterium RIFCSPLOWO2_02_FULL_67_36]OFW23015.1 MAG: hypothetical protein A3G21_00365 [Acidobacteria bacterium RIFCSPLOWO2_12_FULL_66_21]
MQICRHVGLRAIALAVVLASAVVHAIPEQRTVAGARTAPGDGAAVMPPTASDLKAVGSVDRWRRLIAGERGALPPYERLVVADRAGRILRRADGSGRGVGIPPDWMPLLCDRSAALILAHNHPEGQSLSIDDLSQFEKPGVAVTIAVGHDGSLYVAAAGRSYHAAEFAQVYAAASSEVTRMLRLHQSASAAAVTVHRNHLVALALARAGVIVYRADLGLERRQAYNSYGLQFDDIVHAAAAKVHDSSNGR